MSRSVAPTPAEVEAEDAAPAASTSRPLGLRHLVAVGVVAALVATGTSAAFAWSPVFDDVPQSHPFEPQIAWMNATGVTEGYPGDGPIGFDYRPADPVTRGSMSAFMQRLYNLQEMTRYASGDSVTTSSIEWTDIPGAVTSVNLPAGTAGNLHVSFSGESACSGGSGGSYCQVRTMVDPPAGAPGFSVLGPDDDGVAFDSSDDGSESAFSWESHSIDRYDDYIGDPGEYTIKAQFATLGGATLDLDDWVMVAETDLERTDGGL